MNHSQHTQAAGRIKLTTLVPVIYDHAIKAEDTEYSVINHISLKGRPI